MTKPAWLMAPQELATLPHPALPPEPTDEEGRELVARLNAPDGPEVELNAAQIDYLAVRAPVRYTADVAHLREKLDREDDGSPWCVGVRAALEYAEGNQALGPLTGEPSKRRTPPSQGDLGDELRVAIDALASDLDTPLPHPRDFIVAVEHTCMWLRCTTNAPPLEPDQ